MHVSCLICTCFLSQTSVFAARKSSSRKLLRRLEYLHQALRIRPRRGILLLRSEHSEVPRPIRQVHPRRIV